MEDIINYLNESGATWLIKAKAIDTLIELAVTIIVLPFALYYGFKLFREVFKRVNK